LLPPNKRLNAGKPLSRCRRTVTASYQHYLLDCEGSPPQEMICQYVSPYDMERCTSGLAKQPKVVR
jgi:hypothetical protein